MYLTFPGNSPKYAGVPPTILGDQIVLPFSSNRGKTIFGSSLLELEMLTNPRDLL